jgi:ribose-phosphate pyrophosphokinase
MPILNLVYSDNSEINYKVSKFPDGQQSITITSGVGKDEEVLIKSRLNSFMDLELIICATQCLKEMGVKNISLYIPYCIGGRSDRKFVDGGINYIKTVIAPILNSQNYNEVIVLDPHSDILEACINNFRKKTNVDLVKFALSLIDNKDGAQQRTAFISPDAGALKKIYDLAKIFKVENVTTASKIRDVLTGNIVRTELPIMNLDGIEQIVIVDDICDGGRTFIELAKVIREQTDKPIYLIITHGIFSAGYTELNKYFSKIFTTNSIQNIGEVEVVYSTGRLHPTNIKQLNIFLHK